MEEEKRIVADGRENTPLYELHEKIHQLICEYADKNEGISAVVLLSDKKNKIGDASLIGEPEEIAKELMRVATMDNTFIELLKQIITKVRKIW